MYSISLIRLVLATAPQFTEVDIVRVDYMLLLKLSNLKKLTIKLEINYWQIK